MRSQKQKGINSVLCMMGEERKYFIKDSLEAGDIKVCKMQKHKKCREIGNMQFTFTYGHSYKHSYL